MSELLQLLTLTPTLPQIGAGRIHSTLFDNRAADVEDDKWFDCQCCSGGFTADEMHIRRDGKIGTTCERCAVKQSDLRKAKILAKKGSQ